MNECLQNTCSCWNQFQSSWAIKLVNVLEKNNSSPLMEFVRLFTSISVSCRLKTSKRLPNTALKKKILRTQEQLPSPLDKETERHIFNLLKIIVWQNSFCGFQTKSNQCNGFWERGTVFTFHSCKEWDNRGLSWGLSTLQVVQFAAASKRPC